MPLGEGGCHEQGEKEALL